jgi:hypothetical protein
MKSKRGIIFLIFYPLIIGFPGLEQEIVGPQYPPFFRIVSMIIRAWRVWAYKGKYKATKGHYYDDI